MFLILSIVQQQHTFFLSLHAWAWAIIGQGIHNDWHMDALEFYLSENGKYYLTLAWNTMYTCYSFFPLWKNKRTLPKGFGEKLNATWLWLYEVDMQVFSL